MRFVATSDLHLHPYRIGSDHAGIDRLEDGVKVLRNTLEIARYHKCTWIFVGDMKMPRNIWHQEALNAALAVLREFPAIDKVLVPGNHDGTGPRGTGLSPFADIERVHVIEAPSIFDDETTSTSIAIWPYGGQRLDGMPAFLKQAAKAKARVIFAHAFLSDVLLGDEEYQLPGIGIAPEVFGLGDVFNLGVFGDIHKGQIRLKGKWVPFTDLVEEGLPSGYSHTIFDGKYWHGEAIYPGSPYQQSWGEAADWPKGCVIIDTKKITIEFCPVDSPRFRIIDWRSSPAVAFTPEHVDGLVVKGEWSDDVVRVFAGPWYADKAEVLEVIRVRSGARTFEVIPPTSPKPEARMAIHSGMSKAELFAHYTASRPLDGYTADAITKIGLKLAEET